MKRVKIGVCTGFENFELAAELGFDYVECSLSALAALSDEEFNELRKNRIKWKIPVYSCNGMIPGSIPCVGPNASDEALEEYLNHAFRRAMLLRVQPVVFGSGASRGVPEGWTHEEAWRQLVHFLKIAAKIAHKYLVQIAIEPLRRAECNIINYVSEGTALAAVVDEPTVGVLGDTFHMNAVGEPYEALAYAGCLLKHVHISHSPDRTYPKEGDGEDYGSLFDVLDRIGYEGGVSIEAGTQDLRGDGAAALRHLQAIIRSKGAFLINRKELEKKEGRICCKVMACPMVIKGAIAPVPGYLYGRVSADGMQGRIEQAIQWMDGVSEEDKAILAESYQDECDVIREMDRLFQTADLDTDGGEAKLMEALLIALNGYLDKPEMERKTYFI